MRRCILRLPKEYVCEMCIHNVCMGNLDINYVEIRGQTQTAATPSVGSLSKNRGNEKSACSRAVGFGCPEVMSCS